MTKRPAAAQATGRVKRRAWWLGGVALVLLLPLAALGVAAVLVDPNDYKPQLVDAVQGATGRTLTVGGPLRISRSLWPTIEVTDVKLGNLPGGTRPDMARAERIEAQLSLFALLRRRIELSRLTLIGPDILFELVGGRPNWVFGSAAAAPAAAPAAPARPAAPHPGFPVTLGIRAATVRNGMVTIRLPGRTHVVGIRSLRFRQPEADGPLELASVLVYSDYQPFSLGATAQPTGGDSDPWSTQLRFAAGDAALVADGRMSLAGSFDFQTTASIPELGTLNALLPPLRLPKLHGVTLSSHVTSGRTPGDLPVIGETAVRITGGDLTDRVPGLTLGAVEASLPHAGGAATVSGSGRFADSPFGFNGTVGVPGRFEGRTSTPVALNVEAGAKGSRVPGKPDGTVALNGKLALNTGSFDGLDAKLGVRVPALAAWRAALPSSLPSLPVLTDASLDAQLGISADRSALKFRDAKLSARELDMTGTATVGLEATLAIEGRLRAARLDLDALLPGSASPQGAPAPNAAAPAANEPVIPSTSLPWAVLRGKTANLAGSIAALTFRQQVWRDVDLGVQLADGRLQVEHLRLALPAGPLEMSASADASKQEVPVSVALHAPGIPFPLVTRYASLPGAAAGALRVDAQFQAKGRSARDLAASLDGPFTMTMTHGSLSNAALIELASASLDALGIAVPAQGETAIRCFGLVGRFKAGVGRFRTVALDTTYLQLDGVGQVDLGAETLAFKLHPLARVSGSSVSVPVLVEGPFRAVQGRLDASGLDKLGLLLDAWFGGDQPQTCSDAGLVPASPGGG